jgi:aspartate-semialdehyde dehydrogenase
VVALAAPVSCTCTRIAVLDGHTGAVFASLERAATVAELERALSEYRCPDVDALPSAPPRWIAVHRDPYRPQPRRDREAGAGMTTSVGRLRLDSTLKNGIKLVWVSHNTKMGAAKGAILLAELCKTRGLLG